jgi:hypothetical protein
VSIHSKGRVCVLDVVDFENARLGIPPKCKDHRHVNRAKAFEISRNPRFGRLVGFLASAATTKDDIAPAGCFVEVAGVIEYVHLRKTTNPKLKVIYAVGERIAAQRKKVFRHRSYYLVPS